MSDKRRMAIGAAELREGQILLGDAICPTRFSAGSRVAAVNDDLGGMVLVLTESGDQLEYPAGHTVYVAR